MTVDSAGSGELTEPPREAAKRVGSYELLHCLGRGGFANVYAARDVGSGEMLAVKLLAGDDAEARRRFDGEVARLRRLSHPALPRLIDAGREGRFLYLAMELVDGEALDVALAARRFALQEVLALLDALCDALAHVHGLGILHRDIKPQNILLRGDGSPVLVDFGLGLSAEVTRVTRAGALVGTLRYMSPEQLTFDGDVDARSDLFQLGLVAYELLTGHPAHAVPERPSLGDRYEQAVLAPSKLNPEVPSALDALILGLLSVERERRPASARAFRTELRALRGGRRRATARHALVAGSRTARFVVPVLWMLVTGALVLWWAGRPAPRPRPERGWTVLPESAAPAPTPSARAGLETLTDQLGPGRVTLELVRIPAGCVRIGTPENLQPQRFLGESPAHRVCVKAFYLGKFEVTQAQYRAVMGINPSMRKGSSLPVTMVSHEDCDIFLGRLNRMTGRGYRLPTEAEWEYACRAGSEGLYPWGDDPVRGVLYGWTQRNAQDRCHEVGSLQPNAFGLFDMLGNVAEWVVDSKHESYVGAPTDGRAWVDPRYKFFVARGGGADMEPGYCRCAMRYSPFLMVDFVGLRVACDL